MLTLPDPLVWIDLEMTGLDADHDRIVEIACVVTDANLAVVGEAVHCVVHQPDDMLAVMEDVVREMHQRSGLLHAIRQSAVDVDVAQERVLAYLRRHVEAGSAPLCGNSIGTDRNFVAKYMPAFDDYLHYRSIDVSSLKELCRRWCPEIYESRPSKAGDHRAMHDVLDSISELRFYRERAFGPEAQATR